MIRVTVFNEYVHERNEAKVREVYPNGIHGAIAQALGMVRGSYQGDRTATRGELAAMLCRLMER